MSKRTDQVASLLVREINNFLVKNFESPSGTLVSVSRCTVSPDLKNATAYLSILPHNKVGTCLEAVRRYTSAVQRHINRKLEMKFVPQLTWEIDDTDIKYEAIDNALQN